MLILLGSLLASIIITIIVCICVNYYDGKNESGCNARISFELFRKMYEKFPDKWYLHDNFVEFYYETTKYGHIEAPARSFRGYFSIPDLLRYTLYKREDDIQKRKEREAENYNDIIKEFERLERVFNGHE